MVSMFYPHVWNEMRGEPLIETRVCFIESIIVHPNWGGKQKTDAESRLQQPEVDSFGMFRKYLAWSTEHLISKEPSFDPFRLSRTGMFKPPGTSHSSWTLQIRAGLSPEFAPCTGPGFSFQPLGRVASLFHRVQARYGIWSCYCSVEIIWYHWTTNKCILCIYGNVYYIITHTHIWMLMDTVCKCQEDGINMSG